MSSHPDKAFGFWSATFLGIGAMVGAGIFIVIGEAGAIAGPLVTISFLFSGIIALCCGYSLSQLALRYPSRGGIIEYLVQCYGEGFFSGTLGLLFYIAQLVTLAAVIKSFGTYAATFISDQQGDVYINVFSFGILLFFTVINLLGASLIAQSENLIVIIKLFALIAFTIVAFFFIQPANLSLQHTPTAIHIFYTLGLTFFAYQGFSIITNSVEDMSRPEQTLFRAMIASILIVAILYISISVAVFGNLPLATIIHDKDFALAEAARPAFGEWGFKIMATTALLATASAINATLYSVTQISYTLAKEGDLPEEYTYHVFHNTEGLLISAALVLPFILFFNLAQIASIAAISVLLIQGLTHVGHLFTRQHTQANLWWILAAILGTFSAAGFALKYVSQSMPNVYLILTGLFFLAFVFEVLLRLVKQRQIRQQHPASR